MRWRIGGSLLLVGVAIGFLIPRGQDPPGPERSRTLHLRTHPAQYIDQPEDRRVAARIVPWGPRDYFRVIVAPSYLSVADAEPGMSDDEVVLGLALGGQARAYPINYLNDHEMVADELAGVPILTTW